MQFDTRRREFITLLAGAAAWPGAALGQQSKLPKIGYLSDESPYESPKLDPLHSHDVILGELHRRGYDDGRNIVVEYRYADRKAELLPSLAADLVAIPVDLIVAIGSPASRAATAATQTIPIVMARVGDPVAYGLVTSLARPGGNATGVSVFTQELAGKRLEVLKDAVPGLTHLAVLYEPNFPPGELELKQFTAAAQTLKVEIQAVAVQSPAALQGSPTDIINESSQALFVGSSLLIEMHPAQTVDFAFKSRLPALYIHRQYAEIGGMMAYGVDFREMYRTAADYIVRILRGANPGDLPVQLPAKIELIVNLKTARALDVTIPELLLAAADEVIE